MLHKSRLEDSWRVRTDAGIPWICLEIKKGTESLEERRSPRGRDADVQTSRHTSKEKHPSLEGNDLGKQS